MKYFDASEDAQQEDPLRWYSNACTPSDILMPALGRVEILCPVSLLQI